MPDLMIAITPRQNGKIQIGSNSGHSRINVPANTVVVIAVVTSCQPLLILPRSTTTTGYPELP